MLRMTAKSVCLVFAGTLFAATLAAQAPAPKRDISGTWTPERRGGGIGANGASNHTSDGKHEPPYTAAGKAAFMTHKPSNGITEVGPGEENDPGHTCDPLGMPRALTFEQRDVTFVHQAKKTLILTQYDRMWRSAFTDGRTIDMNAEPRWYGYSIAKWADDYTFVVTTSNIEDRAWLDNAGRPQSDQMSVEEQWHRIDHDNLELTVTVTDPKFYSAPWVAINKLKMKLLPEDHDMIEMMCVPSELAAYNVRHANLGNGITGKK
ncbi:MAG: hypothetical protein ABL967_09955 [Bryobacteraceae bacterium]